jgi:hypothetical protein
MSESSDKRGRRCFTFLKPARRPPETRWVGESGSRSSGCSSSSCFSSRINWSYAASEIVGLSST